MIGLVNLGDRGNYAIRIDFQPSLGMLLYEGKSKCLSVIVKYKINRILIILKKMGKV